MKKFVVIMMVIATIATMFSVPAFAAGKEAIGETTLPLSKAGSYNNDPDEKITSVWEGETTEQFTAVDYAYNGWLIGPSSKSDALVLGKESHHIPMYAAEVIDENRMPKEVLEMLALAKSGKISKIDFQVWFGQFIVGNITRLEMISGVYATTLNAEVYSRKLHGQPLATLQLGPKKASYWNIYERTLKDGTVVWTLCRQPATNNGGKKPDPTPTPKPEEKPPVVVPTIEEEPARTPDPKPPVVVPTIEEEPARTPDPKPPVVVPTIEEKPAQTPAPKQEPPVVSPTIEEQPAQQTAAQPTTEPPVHQKDNGDAGKGPAF